MMNPDRRGQQSQMSHMDSRLLMIIIVKVGCILAVRLLIGNELARMSEGKESGQKWAV